MAKPQKPWEVYEQAARIVVNDLRQQLGLINVEGKQELLGTSGASWEIDGKAILVGQAGFLVMEARRRTTSGQKQEDIAAIAYRIHDLGGTGGIIVSPLPLQTGAKIIAEHANIHQIRLESWSTAENYLAEFMGRTFYGIAKHDHIVRTDQFEVTVIRAGKPA